MPNVSFITNPGGRKPIVLHSNGRGDSKYYHVDTSGLPESYADLVAANPYLNYDYTPGLWDRVGNFLGFRTREDKYREEMQQASREYETQLISMSREEAYNSPLEQAARQRKAGINSDLNGVSPDSAAEYSEPETHPVPPEGGEALSFVGNMLSAMTSLMGLAQGWTNLRGSMIDNDLKDANFVSSLFNTGRNAFLNLVSPEQLLGLYKDPEKASDGFTLSSIGIDPSYFHSKRAARRFGAAMNSAARSITGRMEGYGRLNIVDSERVDMGKRRGSVRWSDDDDELNRIMGYFGDAVYDVLEKDFRNQNKRLDFENRRVSADLQNGVPELESSAYAEGLEGQEESSRVSNEVNKSLRNLVHRLHQEAEGGSFLANTALMLIGILPHVLGGAQSILGMRSQLSGIRSSEASAAASEASAALNQAKRYRLLGF